MNPRDYLDNPNVKAFLRTIRFCEGTADDDGYRRLVGGGEFDSFADHPRQMRRIARYNINSSAAGAYQFLSRSWDEMAAIYGLKDFSPESQDLAAIGLISRRNALMDVVEGRITEAVEKCNKEWASLPGSPYGQRTVALSRVLQEYRKWGGKEESHAAPITESKPTWEAPMDPFTAATIGALVKEIPGLIRSFGSEGRVTERNAKAAEILINSVQAATGTTTGQAAVEAIRSDPEVKSRVTQQLDAEGWFEVTEAGGGGIEGARAYSTQMKGESVTNIPAFWITLALLPLLYGTVYFVLTGDKDAFSGELRAAIASSVVTGVLGGVIGYWLGLKFSATRSAVTNLGR